MNTPSQTFDKYSRRSFIKSSVLTAGAITFLSAGTALAGNGDYMSGTAGEEDCTEGGKCDWEPFEEEYTLPNGSVWVKSGKRCSKCGGEKDVTNVKIR